ncbi:MAG: methylmalonyl-CoA mutase [Chloroflexi bacterium]|jgi:methylmalonyl-CoA mutase N-terminal domain/subunit|nr:methylmalonyl-CoA mutase [Chloroflexota bacterium]MCH2304068.1 methylmalonyl-CoA mutase family protein [SAR202 cluster bacterium]|tara:strand:- start:141 stop:1793 length:1653 start_codon:yes stop_codon:yes gene_type:complete
MQSKSKKEWNEQTLNPLKSRFKERKENFDTDSGIPIKPLYTNEDNNFEYSKDLGYPGEYPYTRGVQANMYRGRLWSMRQYAGLASPEESNNRYRYLLDQGQTGLSVAFDLPTQTGYDSDHPMSLGEVGKSGVPISSLSDMEILFKDIPLEKVSTSMTINATAPILLALYIAVAKRQGANINELKGTIQNDILKEYIARGTYIYPPEQSMRLVTDIFEYCSKNLPKWNTISVSGYHIREAGSTAIQELAFTFSNAITYVEYALETGLNIDDFAGQLSFFFVAQNNLFEEIAKFRAARRIWANIMKNRFKAKNPRSCMLRFHTQTAGVTLTAQQTDNNIIRTTVQALGAILGGTQSLHVNSKDEALGLPTEESAQISLRTQQILAYESGISETVDPLAGSYYIEELTNELENSAMEYINKIDHLGGALKALDRNFQVDEIHNNAYKLQNEIDDNKRIVVGVNKFQSEKFKIDKIQSINPLETKKQLKRLNQTKSKRSNKEVKASLKTLKEIATTKENIFPQILKCVECYATLGEISNVLREVFGEYTQLNSL